MIIRSTALTALRRLLSTLPTDARSARRAATTAPASTYVRRSHRQTQPTNSSSLQVAIHPSLEGGGVAAAAAATAATLAIVTCTCADSRQSLAEGETFELNQNIPSIAVIGGGIAGVTAARAIATRLNTHGPTRTNANIVIYEGDIHAKNGQQMEDSFASQRKLQPEWNAATAKNANSIVPGAAMHIISQRSTLKEIFADTVNEWLMLHIENFRTTLSEEKNLPIRNIDNFDVLPPYFALHLFRCLGPSATMEERLTFLTFLRHFVPTSMLSGEKDVDDRGKYIVQLAKANREAFLKDLKDSRKTQEGEVKLEEKIGLGTGFVSLHRTRKKAQDAVQEAHEHGEQAELLSWEEAVELEPRIKNLPIGSLHAVHRLKDNTANCAKYIRDLIARSGDLGIQYRFDGKSRVKDIERLSNPNHPRFRVSLSDGSTRDYDCVVLAAGVETPLLARKLGVGRYCPTYPLRGYSLTLFTDLKTREEMSELVAKGKSPNLLNRPISIDNIYCSSVGPNMARLAGFGELVGYVDKAKDVESVGPRVLARYGKTLFPDGDVSDIQALQCFRPMSPDDLPLVGAVKTAPGLFLHTGHGAQGWTLSMATAECVAQAVCDRIHGITTEMPYVLPDGTTMDRDVMSPNRFVWSAD